MSSWSFCNTTAETQEISEIPLSEHTHLTFHGLAILISFSSGSLAILLSFFLIWMHALNYTKPAQQKNIIRILLMVPIYATANFLQLVFYHHAVYYSVISDCYEAFAISAFFSLMCQYIRPSIHEQKNFFRNLYPVAEWVWPLNWFAKCCGGEKGPWRTPKNGLTWFNIIWIGVYHYCFIRVAMTIVAVVTQHYKVYCESSMSPLFSHVWVIAVESIAVAIAMYCVIQFYVQFKEKLAGHQPFLKVLAIKGVIFLSFWQATAISVASTELNIITANAKLAYPDISTGLPAVLESVEMLIFAIVHIWAYPWHPYRLNGPKVFYPEPDNKEPMLVDAPEPPSGGFVGLWAIVDALNFWDVVKAFGRGLRWLFSGVKHRHEDSGYPKNAMDGDDGSTYGMKQHSGRRMPGDTEEGAGLIAHAVDPSEIQNHYGPYDEEAPYESSRLGLHGTAADQSQMTAYPSQLGYPQQIQQQQHSHAITTDDDYTEVPKAEVNTAVMTGREEVAVYPPHDRPTTAGGSQPGVRPVPTEVQQQLGKVLWGPNPHNHPNGPMM